MKNLLAITFTLLSFQVSAQYLDYEKLPSANAKIYYAQGLAHNVKDLKEADKVLLSVVEDEQANEEVVKYVRKARSVISSYQLKRFSPSIPDEYKSFDYNRFQNLIATALLKSRVTLNGAYDQEGKLVEDLLKNYFFPLGAHKVEIKYPNVKSSIFNPYSVDGTSHKERLAVALKDLKIDSASIAPAMLLEAVANPMHAITDPQLQAFVKGVRIEIHLGESKLPSEGDLSRLQDIVTKSNSAIAVNISKLVDADDAGIVSNVELEYRKTKNGKSSELVLVSSASGEDLMFNKLFQNALNVTDYMEEAIAVGDSVLGLNTLANLPDVLDSIGSVILAGSESTSKIAKYQKAIGANLQGMQNAMAAFKNSNPKFEKFLDATVRSDFVENGSLDNVIAVLGVVMEATRGYIEYQTATNNRERAVAVREHLSYAAADVMYLIPIVGTVTYYVDIVHDTVGLPFESADFFRASWYVGESIALYQQGLNHTTNLFRQLELENHLPVTKENFVVHGGYMTKPSQGNDRIQRVITELQNAAYRQLSVIYKFHVISGDKANKDVKKKLQGYHQAIKLNVKYARDSIDFIKARVQELKVETCSNSNGVHTLYFLN